MNQSNILTTRVFFKNMSFEFDHRGGAGVRPITTALNLECGIIGVRADRKGVKLGFKIKTSGECDFTFGLNGVVLVGFKEIISLEVLKNHELYEMCFHASVGNIVETIASNSNRMGTTPLIFDQDKIKGLFSEAVRKLSLEKLKLQ